MCGIVAYLGKNNCANYIIDGLKQLQNRGYDSVGISYIENSSLNTLKYASTNTHNSLEKLESTLENMTIVSTCGIGHTRWATHGGKTDANAHPHHDNLNRIAIVHNGIIENFSELKQKLIKRGYSFTSQTDTEVIAVLIGYYLDSGLPIEEAIKCALEELIGTWALIIIHKNFPNKMWITRNGSPLLLGFEDDSIMVASEQIALNDGIKKYVALNNNDLIEITNNDGIITFNTNIHHYQVKEKVRSESSLTPSHGHWMLSEIMEQPDAIIRALNNGGRINDNVSVKLGGLDSRQSDLLNINHLIILGCGTSYNAGHWSLDIFKSLDIFDTVVCYDGAEFNVKDIPKRGKSGVILLSQSGETRDLHRCIQIAKDYDLITIGVVNVVDSQISRETACGVYLNAGREVAVASTKSFTNQCIVLSMIAVWFSQNRGTALEKRRKIITDLRNISFQMKTTLENDTMSEKISTMLIKNNKSATNNNNNSIFLLGKGRDEAIANEGSLKLKEIAYLHAEGYSTSALKHGTFALIEEGLPIFVLDISDENREKNRNAIQEVLARGALVFRFTDIKDCPHISETEEIIVIEKNSTYGGLLVNAYIQLISYQLALLKGINPDYPRNLAKVVTVE